MSQPTVNRLTTLDIPRDGSEIALRSRRSATGFIAAVAAATVLLYAFSSRGPGPSIANPDPRGAFSEQGVPRPHPAVFGFEYWPQLFEGLSFVAFVVLWVVGLLQTYRRGRWSPVLTMTATALTLSLLDPIMNWAPFASYNPTLLHLPETWFWVRLAPTVEPMVVWLGYTYYWLIPAWTLLWLYRKLIRATSNSSSWYVRRPMLALSVLAYPACFMWDLGIELALTRTGLIAYTQVIPPVSMFTGESWQYPIVLNSGFMAVSIFMAAALMWQDDTGLTFAERTANRFRIFRNLPNLGTYLTTLAIMGTCFLTYLLAFGIVRSAGLGTGTSQPWPYPETKVYDPQGYFEDHGEPGPFMTGSWTGWERNAR